VQVTREKGGELTGGGTPEGRGDSDGGPSITKRNEKYEDGEDLSTQKGGGFNG